MERNLLQGHENKKQFDGIVKLNQNSRGTNSPKQFESWRKTKNWPKWGSRGNVEMWQPRMVACLLETNRVPYWTCCQQPEPCKNQSNGDLLPSLVLHEKSRTMRTTEKKIRCTRASIGIYSMVFAKQSRDQVGFRRGLGLEVPTTPKGKLWCPATAVPGAQNAG